MSRLARDVANTEALYVKMGKWINKNIEKDIIIAANDIGGMAYFGGHKIVDVMGLASPEEVE
ncbi:MAG: hypothetical protein GKR87_15470 [Kiritimatiellae bacterium]|nr:hypothetical protein [Kiritimatiellia bacterium]